MAPSRLGRLTQKAALVMKYCPADAAAANEKRLQRKQESALLTVFNATFILEETEVDEDSVNRMHALRTPFEVPLTGGLQMKEVVAAVAAALYGPLQPGQEEERWQVLTQARKLISAGNTSTDGAVDEFQVTIDYQGTTLALVVYALDFDKRVPEVCPQREELDDAKWEALKLTQPKSPDALRRECMEMLVRKTKAALERGNVTLQEELMHGMWELAVKKEHLPDLPEEAFGEMVGGTYSIVGGVRWKACAAMWCVAVSSAGRRSLLREGCVPALQAVLTAACAPGTAEHGGADPAFTCALRDRLFVHAVGALGVLVVDKAARDAYMTTDPGFKTLIAACVAPVLDPPLAPPFDEATVAAVEAGEGRAVREFSEVVRDRRRARSRRRVMAAETLASTLLRDSDARVSLLRAGNLGALSGLLRSDHVAITLAASVILSTFARDPVSNVALREAKDLPAVLDGITDAIDWALTRLVGPALPSVEELIAAAAAEKAAAAATEAKAAAKAGAEAAGKYWEDPDAEADAVAAACCAATTAMAAAKAAEPVEGAELIPQALQTLIVSMWGFVRATVDDGGSMKDKDMLQILQICRRAADADPDVISEATVYGTVGVLASLCEDRTHCARLLAFGARPETPAPFTEKELEDIAREELRCHSRSIKFVHPTRDKAAWDPTKSILESIKSCLTPDDDDEGRTRTMAVAVVGLMLEPSHSVIAEGEAALEGPYRTMVSEDQALVDVLLEAVDKGATAEAFEKPLHEAGAACLMYLSSTYGLRYTPSQLRRILALMRQTKGPRASHGALQFMSAGLWCVARSPEGRAGLLEHAPSCISDTIEMAFVLRTAVAAAGVCQSCAGSPTFEEEDVIASAIPEGFVEAKLRPELLPCVKGLEFAMAALWLMSYGAGDKVLDHGDVFEVRSGAVWTVPRVSTPSNETANLAAGLGGVVKEDVAAEAAAARALAAGELLAKIKAAAVAAAERREGEGDKGQPKAAAAAATAAPTGDDADVADDPNNADAATADADVDVDTDANADNADNAVDAVDATDAAIAADTADKGTAATDANNDITDDAVAADVAAVTAKPPTPTMSVDQATARFAEATQAAEEAAAAAVSARAEAAKATVAMRRRLIELLISVINLPASSVTGYARRLAMSMAWNMSARSTAARRELIAARLFDALEACACDGRELATIEVTTLAAAVMESLLSCDEVAAAVGGPARLSRTALHLVASPMPQEQERGARGLAFITSFHDLIAVKSDLIHSGAAPLLLRLLVPDESSELGSSLPDGVGTVHGAGSGGGGGSGESGEVSEMTEVRRCAELFAAGALLNLSTLPAAQIVLAKRGLYTLLKANASPMVARRHVGIGEGELTGGQMIAGTIQNVACHPENRTRFYKLELRAKAMERVLHNQKMTRHMGRYMEQAGRVVGESFERALEQGVKYEVASRRRVSVGSAGVDDAGDPGGGAHPLGSKSSKSMPILRISHTSRPGASGSSSLGNMELPPLLTEMLMERGGRGRRGSLGGGGAALSKKGGFSTFTPLQTTAAPSPHSRAGADASRGEQSQSPPPPPPPPSEEQAMRRTAVESRSHVKRGEARGAASLPDEDWLTSILNSTDEVSYDGLTLLAQSMRKPLWNLWARPEEIPDHNAKDPKVYGERGLTRVHLHPLHVGNSAPSGNKRWRPPIREYVQVGTPMATTLKYPVPGTEASGAAGTWAGEAEPRGVESGVRMGMGTASGGGAGGVLASASAMLLTQSPLGGDGGVSSLGAGGRTRSLAPLSSTGSSGSLAAASRAPFIADTANRLLATARPGSVHLRLEDKAREAALAVAVGAPQTFGGLGSGGRGETGSDDTDSGGTEAPSPTLPVTLMMPKVEMEAELSDWSTAAPRGALGQLDIATSARHSEDAAVRHRPPTSLSSSVNQSSTSEYAPLKVVLHPAGPRNCINFVSDMSRDPDVARRNSSLVMFEHIPGARVHQGLFPAYPLPNGRNTFYYHTGNTLVEEVRVTPDALPDRPVTLDLALQMRLPQSDVLHRMAAPEAAGALGYKPVPVLCPLPDSHTLDVTQPGDLTRDAFGDLAVRNLRFGCIEQAVMRTSEESLVVPSRFLEPYTVHKSVFAPRLRTADSRDFFDRTPVFLTMFDNDWRHVTNKVKFTTFVRTTPGPGSAEDKLAAVKEVMRDYYDELEGAFRYYSVTGSGREFSMQLNEFSDFADACNLPDPQSKFCKRAHIDTLFKAANFEEKATGKEAELVSKLNEDNALTRFEFVEIMVRVADAKYLKEKTCDTLVEAINVMFEECIIPNLAPEALLDVCTFRTSRLYCDDVDDVYRGVYDAQAKYDKNGYRTLEKGLQFKALENLYDAFRMPVGGGTIMTRKMLQMDQWMYMCGLLGLLDLDESGFTIREARLCYVFGKMRTIDDFKDVVKYESLTFTDFLESLARCAEAFPLPSREVMRKEGYDSGVAYMIAIKAKTGAAGFPCRGSRAFVKAKTRPLAEKLQNFLDYLFRCVFVSAGCLDEEYTLEKAVEVFRGIRRRRKEGTMGC